jgi:hypothetical protein
VASRITVTTLGPGDFSSAPPWAHRLLTEWSQGKPWELNVYHEVVDGRISQHFDVVALSGGVWATGEHHALLRHVSKDSVNVIARGAGLGKENGLFVPVSFLQHKDIIPSGLVDEYAWLLGVSVQVVHQLLESGDVEADIKRLVPDAQSIWRGYYDQAIRAVNLQ